jgi:hypothetical protein
MTNRLIAIIACVAPIAAAQAYCIQNELKGRDVRVVQEEHPSALRVGKELDLTLKPGEKHCCVGKNLDCNPGGGVQSITRLAITVPGTPAYQCGVKEGTQTWVKVTGGGDIRVVNNPKPSQASPYVARVRTQDADVSGPSGIVCPEYTPKAN